MFVSGEIPTFDELLHKSVYNFAKRIERSTNAIISFCLSVSLYLYFPIRKWWNLLLFILVISAIVAITLYCFNTPLYVIPVHFLSYLFSHYIDYI